MSQYLPSISPVKTEIVQPVLMGGLQQIVFVIMENNGLSNIYTPLGGAASYMTSLAQQNAFSLNWTQVLPDPCNCSEPEYGAISFGDVNLLANDGARNSVSPPSFLDFIAASGRSWKVIQNGSRGADHNAFLQESPRPSGGSMVSGDSPAVIAEAQAGTNFVWFTPSDNQNMHDNPVSDGDNWLSSWIPQLLTAMAPRKSLLIITFDEGNYESSSSSLVYTAFIGNAAKKNYTSQNRYDHYSFGRLIESLWGGSGLRNCDSAAVPTEFLA